jgi:hypothetical protein
VITKSEALDRIVDRRADVAERLLHKTVANRAKDETDPGTDQHKRKKYLDVQPKVELKSSRDIVPQPGDDVSENLRQGHLNADVDEEQGNAGANSAGILPQESENPDQVASSYPWLIWDRIGHG